MASFKGWGSTVSGLQSHYKKAVYILTINSPEISGAHLIDLGRMKG